MISCSSSFDFLPLEEPPRYSIVQGSFFRIRDPNATLYPSRCYAIPDVPAIRTSFGGNSSTNTHPIRFIGVNSASFDENDPPTVLRRGSTEMCNDEATSRRRSSVVMESAETKRNDEILRRLDDDDDDDDLLSGRRSISGRRQDVDMIPTCKLRNYMKRQKEIQEVNERYAEMCAKWSAERNTRENMDLMEIEESYPLDEESSIFSQSILSGTIDDVVQRNNVFNRRLSGLSDSDSVSTSFDTDHLCSPRLSKADIEFDEPVMEESPKHVFTFDLDEVIHSRVDSLRQSLAELPEEDVMYGVMTRINGIMSDQERVLHLFNYVESNYTQLQMIDDLQGEVNAAENACNSYQIQEYLLMNSSNMIDLGDKLFEYISIYAYFAGWKASYSDRRDLLLKFFFRNEYFFLKVSFSNGELFQVKKSIESITNDTVLSMLRSMRVVQNIRSEYRCFEFYSMFPSVHFEFGLDL